MSVGRHLDPTAWLVLLVLLAACPLTARARGGLSASLRRATLEEPDLVPPWCAVRIESEIPAALAGRPIAVKRDGGRLLIDLEGRGVFKTRLVPGKPRVLETGKGDARRPVLVFNRLAIWYAASASLVRGRAGRTAIEVLDVDLDGRFDGKRDAIRIGSGAFRPVVADELALVGDAFCRYHIRLRDEDSRWVLDVKSEPPLGATQRTARDALVVLSAFRNGVGLGAVLENEERSRACALHVAYWAQNGFSKHDEDPTKPGYTDAGRRAGMASSVSTRSTPAETVRRIAGTVLHRQTCVGLASQGLGVAWDPGSCLWGGDTDTRHLPGPILVPGPGLTKVPLCCVPERPSPDGLPDFYASKRGYPVSATWMPELHDMKDVHLRLWRLGKERIDPVDGFEFTPEAPYARRHSGNASAAYFVAKAPLEPKQRYCAEFTGTHRRRGAISIAWVFETL